MIYKILTAQEWAELCSAGESAGSPLDIRDGYIHFSTRDTAERTAALHFAGARGLQLLAYATEPLSADETEPLSADETEPLSADETAPFQAALRWEPARGGTLFPHLYAPLTLQGLLWSEPLPLGKDGAHIFPPRFYE